MTMGRFEPPTLPLFHIAFHHLLFFKINDNIDNIQILIINISIIDDFLKKNFLFIHIFSFKKYYNHRYHYYCFHLVVIHYFHYFHYAIISLKDFVYVQHLDCNS